LSVPVMAVADCPTAECVIVPAIGCKMPGPLQQALARDDVTEATSVLRDWAAAGTRIAAACVGTFVLAQAGLLDQHEATTSWWSAIAFSSMRGIFPMDGR
jgi:transcriptional regulator GlxA family with amidase domain